MSVFRYSKYKIRLAPDSGKIQGLHVGDLVRRQYAERDRSVQSLMAVLDTGADFLGGKESPYFIGALLDGDEPQNGELLDFVRITNLFDDSRSGALYLTASDSAAPYMDIIDGMATERSLCYPVMAGGVPNTADRNKYTVVGTALTADYFPEKDGITRILHLTRTASSTESCGLQQTLEERVCHPERLLISFRIRASAPVSAIPISFGYTDGTKVDAEDTMAASTEWEYRLWVITVEYPEQYARNLHLDLTAALTRVNAWCEIAELNIVRLSTVSAFTESVKARIGRISGIADPLFGVLEGYGAYFQQFYATRNVNIAGTLTAGDENGFASTFYVGKIHKNVIPDSLSCRFNRATEVQDATPTGAGKVVRITGESTLQVQQAAWREACLGKYCCFSLWLKSEQAGTFSLYQDEHLIDKQTVSTVGEWRRHKVVFPIRPSTAAAMHMTLSTEIPLLLTAPQLEMGKTATPYQPTDAVLSYTEDYGAWFSKGGIGGTIQNPLLRLNADGSISSRDNSFVIHPDGSGQFANGRFRWTQETIELRDMTIRWEELDTQTQEQMKPRYVALTGATSFHYADPRTGDCEPLSIALLATEYNFVAASRHWDYLQADGTWRKTEVNSLVFELTPSFQGWQERSSLTLKYTALHDGKEYSATHTVFKLYDGESAYSVYVESTNGTVFRLGTVSTVLIAHVYSGGREITDDLPESCFRWRRTSTDTAADNAWNAAPPTGKRLEITDENIRHKVVYSCEVEISDDKSQNETGTTA